MAVIVPARSALGDRAPVHRLPAELLALIFTFGAEHDPREAQCDGVDASDASITSHMVSPCQQFDSRFPLVVSAVCRRWRDISLGHKQLWSKICVTGRDVEGTADNSLGPSSRFPIVSEYLRRAGKHTPIDIMVDARKSAHTSPLYGCRRGSNDRRSKPQKTRCTHQLTVECLTDLLRLLLPSLSRWRSFAVITDLPATISLVLDSLSPSSPHSELSRNTHYPLAPLLESLTLVYESTDPTQKAPRAGRPFGIFEGPAGAISHMPQLRHLALSGVHIPWPYLPHMLPAPSPAHPHTGLRSLSLSHSRAERPSSAQWHALLGRCPHLESLAVSCTTPVFARYTHSEVLDPVKDPVPLPHLTALALQCANAADALALLRALDAPNLRDLTLANPCPRLAHDRTGQLLAHLSAPAAYPNPSPNSHSDPGRFPLVQTLSLQGIIADQHVFARLFAAFPLLRSLVASHPSDTFAICSALRTAPGVDPASEPLLCPLLRTFDVRGDDLVARVLAEDVLAARAPGGLSSAVEATLALEMDQEAWLDGAECAALGDVEVFDFAQVEVDVRVGSYVLPALAFGDL